MTFMEWCRSYDFIPKKKRDRDDFVTAAVSLAGGLAVAGIWTASAYASYKYGIKYENNRMRDKLLSTNTFDVLARRENLDGEPAVVTLCGLSSRSEDEYVNNIRLWYENRECSEEYMKEHEEMDRERYRQRYADFIGK